MRLLIAPICGIGGVGGIGGIDCGVTLDVRDSLGWTALHYAAYSGHAEIVRILALEKKVEREEVYYTAVLYYYYVICIHAL